MPANKSKPVSWNKLREEARRLKITEESAGLPLDDLIREARRHEDPLGFLSLHAPAGDIEIGELNLRTPDPPSRRLRTVTIEVPILEPTAEMHNGRAHINRHVDARLPRPQGVAYRAIFDALHEQGVRLENGRYVNSYADALRWLLEQIGGKLGETMNDE